MKIFNIWKTGQHNVQMLNIIEPFWWELKKNCFNKKSAISEIFRTTDKKNEKELPRTSKLISFKGAST